MGLTHFGAYGIYVHIKEILHCHPKITHKLPGVIWDDKVHWIIDPTVSMLTIQGK